MTETPEYEDRVLDGAARMAEAFEGFSAAPYRCPAGVWTIGYGSTHDSHGKPVTAATPHVSTQEAHELMRRDLRTAFAAVDADVTVGITDEEEEALVDFAYNVGTGALKGSTLLRKLNAGDYDGAAAEFANWNKGGGRVLAGLVRRREAERKLFCTTLSEPGGT